MGPVFSSVIKLVGIIKMPPAQSRIDFNVALYKSSTAYLLKIVLSFALFFARQGGLVITYLLTVAIFLIVSYLFKYIEIVFFNNIHSILTCIIGLGITFIILIFLTTAIMYVIVPATKELLNRGKNLIKRKAV